MPVDEKKQPIVIKKVKKGGGGHHGGAWKVAYADFVTAMMAFFLLMWLLGSTTQEERNGISDFFQNPSAVQGPGGASTSMIKLGGSLEVVRGEGDPMKQPPAQLTAKEIQRDQARLDELMGQLKAQIESNPTLSAFSDQLLLDITSEGLRIQLVDKEGRPMFDLGSSTLKWYLRDMLQAIAATINVVPNHISIEGHTDARQFGYGPSDYTNWELSADRANAARRELIDGGLNPEKIGRVVGLASSVLFNVEDPYDPINRRISIIVLNRSTERAIGLTDQPADGQVPTDSDAPGTPPPAQSLEQAPSPAAEPRPAPDEPAAAPDSVEGALESILGPPSGQ